MDVLDLLAKISLDDSEYNKGLSEASKTASSMGSKIGRGLKAIGKVAAGAVTAASTAVAGFGAASVKAGATFDASMSQVAATMGTTVDKISNLRDFAQEMGRTTAFSASEAADALNYMALAGYDAETSMNMLPNVLNLAAAGSIDLARASDMVTDAQSALGLSLEETSVMVDQMAKASSKSNTSVEQLGDAMLTIGATARGVAGGTQELSTVLGVLADNGIKGAEGGTHLRNAILSLQTSTDDGIASLAKLGMTYEDMYDSAGNLRSLPEIFQQMSTAMEGMTQQSKDAIISGVFNKTDLAAVNALIGTSTDRWNELSSAIGDSKGAAEAMANTQLDNLSGDITLFKSALEGAQIAISDVLTPSLRDFVQFGTDGLSKLTASFQEGGLSGAMETFGTILSDGLNMIIEKLPSFVEGGMRLLSALGQGLMDNLPVIIDAANQILLMLVQGIIQALPQLVEGAIQILGQLAQFIGENLPTLIPAIVDMILAITEALIDNVDLLIDGALALILGLADGLMTALPRLIEKIPVLVEKLVDAFVRNAPKLFRAAGEIMVQLAIGIIKSIPRLYDAVKKVISTVADFLGGLPDMAKGWGQDLIAGFIDGILKKWNDLKETVSGMAGTVKDYLGFSEPEKGPLSNFHTYAPDMMELFAKGIKDNEDLITDQLNKSFDFTNNIVPTSSNIMNTRGNMSGSKTANDQNIVVNVALEGIASEILRVVKQEAKKIYNSSGTDTLVYGG